MTTHVAEAAGNPKLRRSRRPALLAGSVLGAAAALGACGAGAAAPSHSSQHRGTDVKVTTRGSHGLETLGAPKVDSRCSPGVDPLYAIYQVATTAHPVSALGATSQGGTGPRVVTSGFRTLGGGACTTVLTWTLTRAEHQWTGAVHLGVPDAAGSAVAFRINGRPVGARVDGKMLQTVGVGPAGVTVSVEVAGAHTFSIVVPGNPDDGFVQGPGSRVGPELVVVTDDQLT